MKDLTCQSRDENSGVIEVRFNCLQMLRIDMALEKVAAPLVLRESWYRLSLAHKGEISAGRPVVLTFPVRLGNLPYGMDDASPDCQGEWLPYMIHGLEALKGGYVLAELLTGVYEAIAWGYAEELYAFDGLFDLAIIAGRKRILARKASMEKMRHLSSVLPSVEKIAAVGRC